MSNIIHMAIPAGLIAGQTWMDGHRRMVAVEMGGRLANVEMVEEIPLALIDRSPLNRQIDVSKLKELEDSLREHGQTTPAILRQKPDGRYELVAGERRFTACGRIGREVLLSMVRNYTETEAAEILLIENLQREDLSPIEEAKIYQRLLDLRTESGEKIYTLQKIAEKVHDDGRKLDRVARVLTLLDLPAEVSEALDKGVIPLRVGFLVGRIADPADREKAGKDVLNHPHYQAGRVMTVKEAADWIGQKYQIALRGTDLDKEDPDILDPAAKAELGFTGERGQMNDGSCERCPWLAKNHPVFMHELANAGGRNSKGKAGEQGIYPQTCTRAGCYQRKLEAMWQKEAAPFAAKHKAVRVLTLAESEGLQRFNSPWVEWDDKPSGYDLGRWDKVGETKDWKQLLKGEQIDLAVGRSLEGKAVLVADKKLAITEAKRLHPVLFAEATVPDQKGADKDQSPEEKASAAEALRLRQLEEKMRKGIEEDLARQSLQALYDRAVAEGPGLDLMKALLLAQMRTVEGLPDFVAFIDGGDVPDEWEHETLLERLGKYADCMTLKGLVGACVLAAVWDDVEYSGIERAEDFQKLVSLMKVDLSALEKQIKAKHEAAFEAAEKARLAELQGNGKVGKKSKLKSKSGKSEVPRATELANEEAAVKGILEQGDQERVTMPSRGPEADLFGEEVSPVAVGSGLAAPLAMVEKAEGSQPPPHLERVREWKASNSGRAAGAVADALGITYDEAIACVDYLIDEAHASQNGKDESGVEKADQDLFDVGNAGKSACITEEVELSFDEQVAAFAAQTKSMTDLIGPKPSMLREMDQYREWNAKRMRIIREAKKLQAD